MPTKISNVSIIASKSVNMFAGTAAVAYSKGKSVPVKAPTTATEALTTITTAKMLLVSQVSDLTGLSKRIKPKAMP